MKLINEHIKELKSLCDTYHVRELYVFGSVAQNKSKGSSDIDFLVRFKGFDPIECFDNYMDLKEN